MSDNPQFAARVREAKAVRTSANGPALLSAWRWWLPPAAIALVFILVFVDPFIGDWDALEYTLSALRGYPSSMALGRGLFIFFNHALYLVAHAVFHLQPQQAYLLFKYAVVAQGPLAVIACWVLTRDFSGSKYAATVAALLVTFSPVFVIYSGQVMTDMPALLLTTVALIVHLRGLQEKRVWLVLVGAALLRAGVNLRGTVGFYGPWLLFILAASPLVLLTLPVAFVSEWRQRKLSPILMLAAVGLFANLLLLLNYSTTIGWRYLSTGLPALAPLCANYLFGSMTRRLGTERRAFITSAAAIALIGVSFGVFLWPLRSATVNVRAASKVYDRELMKVPRDAVMISGAQTVAVIYWRGVGAGGWDGIGPGAGWPQGKLEKTIADYLHSGRRVLLDAELHWWQHLCWHNSVINELV